MTSPGGVGGGRGPAWQMIRNVVTNWGTFLVVAVVNFLLTPFVVHSLGNEAYGAWVLLGSLVGYLGLLDLGVRGAVTKYVATHHAQADHAEAGQVASAALTMFTTAGLLAIGGAFAIAQFGLAAFDISEAFLAEARLVLRLGGVAIAMTIVGGVFGGIVVGRQRFDLLNSFSLSIELARAAAVYGALRAGGGLTELALIQLTVASAQLAAARWLSRRVYPELRVRWLGFRRSHLRLILSYGLFAILLHVATMIVTYTDSLVIGAFLPTSLITFYAIGATLVDQARNLVGGISRAIAPLAGALDGMNDTERSGAVLVLGARYATLVALPIVITFIVRGHSFVGLWMGEEYAEPAGDVLVLLALGLWVFAGFQVSWSVMMGLNRHRGLVPAFLAEAVCNIALSVWWVQTHGIYGVAMGTLLPRAVISLVFGPWYAKRVLGVGIARYLFAALIRPSASMLPFALGSWWIEIHWGAANLLVYFAQVALALPLAGVGAWFVFLTTEERRDYAARLRGLRGRESG